MAQRCGNQQIKSQLDCSEDNDAYVRHTGHRLWWPAAARKRSSVEHVKNMLLIHQIVRDEFGEEHIKFRSLLESMLKVDPQERLSATECL